MDPKVEELKALIEDYIAQLNGIAQELYYDRKDVDLKLMYWQWVEFPEQVDFTFLKSLRKLIRRDDHKPMRERLLQIDAWEQRISKKVDDIAVELARERNIKQKPTTQDHSVQHFG